MPDKLQKFYESLKANKNITGLPDDFDIFATAMADTANARKFFDTIKGSEYITGLPETYEDFATAFTGDTVEQPEPGEMPEEFKIKAESTSVDMPVITLEQLEKHTSQKKKSQEESVAKGYSSGEEGLLQPLRSFGKFNLDQERGFLQGREEYVAEQANLQYGYNTALKDKKKLSPNISDEDANVGIINDSSKDVVETIYNDKRKKAYKAKTSIRNIQQQIDDINTQLTTQPGNNALLNQKKQLETDHEDKTKIFDRIMGDDYRALFNEEGNFLDTQWTKQDNTDVQTKFNEFKEWNAEALGAAWYKELAKYKYLMGLREKEVGSVVTLKEEKIATGTAGAGVITADVFKGMRATKNIDPIIKDQYKTVLAMSDAFLLNQDFGAIERTKGKAFLKGLIGEVYTPDSELAERYAGSVMKHGGKVTEEQMAAATPSQGEETAQMFGTTANAMVQLIGTTLLTKGVMSGTGITNTINTYRTAILAKRGKTAVKLFDLGLAMTEGAVRYGLTPSEQISASMGAGEEAAQFILSGLFKGKNVNKIIRPFIRGIVGGSIETVAEYAGEFSKALAENGFDVDDAVNRAFGETKDERVHRLRQTMVLTFSLSMSGQVGKAAATKIFKSGMSQLSDADQVIVQEMINDTMDTEKGIDSESDISDVKPLTNKQKMEFKPTGAVSQDITKADRVLAELDKKADELKERPTVPAKLTGKSAMTILGTKEVTSEEQIEELKQKAEEYKADAETEIEKRKAKSEVEVESVAKPYQLGNKGYDTEAEVVEDLKKIAASDNITAEPMNEATQKVVENFEASEIAKQEKRTGEDKIREKEAKLKEIDVTYIGEQETMEGDPNLDLYNVDIDGKPATFAVPAGSDVETIIQKRNETIEKFGGIAIEEAGTTYAKNLEILSDEKINDKPRARNQALRDIAEQIIIEEGLSGSDLVNAIKDDTAKTSISLADIEKQAARAEQKVSVGKMISNIRQQLGALINMGELDRAEYAKQFKKEARADLKTVNKFEAFKDFLDTEKERLSMLMGGEIYRLGKWSAQSQLTEAQFLDAMNRISAALDRAEERFTKTSAKKLKTDARKALRKDKANTLLTKINKWMKMDTDQIKAEQANIGMQIGNTEVEKIQELSKIEGAEAKEIAGAKYNDILDGYYREIDMSNLFGNIDGKDLTEIKVAQEALKAISGEGLAEAKAAAAATQKIVDDLAEQASDETKGSWTDADIIGTEEQKAKDTSQASDVRNSFTKFKARQAAQEYLFKALDKSAEKGRKVYDWTKSAYYELSKMWRVGQERLNASRHELKKSFEKGLVDIFGTIGAAKVYATQKVEIQLGYAVKNEDGTVEYKRPKVEMTLGQAGHLWMSYQLAENKGYTNRISGIHEGVTYTMEVLDADGNPTNEVFDDLDAMLKEKHPEIIEYMEWLTDEMLPRALPYITPTYKKLTGHELLTYANYLFVNARSTDISADSLTDNSFLTIFQSMVKERKGGTYDLTRNDAIFGMYDYIDNTAKFYGLAEPFHIINRVLSKNEVKGIVGKRGMGSYVSAIRELMITHMNGDKDWNHRVGGWMSRYIGSKIMLNAYLAVKQQVSQLTVLDPKYAPTGRVLAASVRLMKAENRKVAFDIMKNVYGLRERHIIRIEGSLREAKNSGWQRTKIDDFKDTLDSIADRILGSPDPEVRRKWREAMFNILMPTKFGDKFAIKMAGLPLIDAAYQQRLSELKDMDMTEDAAKDIAAQHARETFLHWMNQTQQSSEMTDKRRWQVGLYKTLVPFMNTNMLYTDRIFDAYQDIYRNTKTKAKYLMNKNPGMSQMQAIVLAAAQKNNMKSLQQLFLYQFVLPNLWDAVTTLGFSIKDLWSDDEELRRKAFIRMGTNTALGSVLKGIPVAAQFYGAYEAYRDYGIEEDPSAGILVMFSDLGKTVYYGAKAFQYKGEIKGMSSKEADSSRDKIDKAEKTAFYSGINTLGLPGLVVSRMDEVINQEEYEQEVLRAIMRVGGVQKTTIKRYFNEEY